MLKKLLKVGALAVTLIVGVGAASAAEYYCPETPEGWIQDQKPVYDRSTGKYFQYVVHSVRQFSNKYERDGITWFFKGPIYDCDSGYYAAYYEGRRY